MRPLHRFEQFIEHPTTNAVLGFAGVMAMLLLFIAARFG